MEYFQNKTCYFSRQNINPNFLFFHLNFPTRSFCFIYFFRDFPHPNSQKHWIQLFFLPLTYFIYKKSFWSLPTASRLVMKMKFYKYNIFFGPRHSHLFGYEYNLIIGCDKTNREAQKKEFHWKVVSVNAELQVDGEL